MEQILSDNFWGCLDANAQEKLLDDFYQKKVDSATYYRLLDSLIGERKKQEPKCIVDYYDEFGYMYEEGFKEIDVSVIHLEATLNDNFVKRNFSSVSIKAILDSISRISNLKADDFSVPFMEIVPHERRKYRPWGEGIGVISLSNVYIDKNKAILYYEFGCGPKCGRGEVLFLVKFQEKWRVYKHNRMWDS